MKRLTLLALLAVAACHPEERHPTHTRTWHLSFAEGVEEIVDPELVVDELYKIWGPYGVMFDAYEEDTHTVYIELGDPEEEILGHAYVGGDPTVYVAYLQKYDAPRFDRARLLAVIISHEMGHSYGLPHNEDTHEKPWNGCDIMFSSFWAICTEHVFSPMEEEYLHAQINLP